jgi:hypothetical protein
VTYQKQSSNRQYLPRTGHHRRDGAPDAEGVRAASDQPIHCRAGRRLPWGKRRRPEPCACFYCRRVSHAIVGGGLMGGGRKYFFFEKKKQKTFAS